MKEYIKYVIRDFKIFLRWLVVAPITGIIVGLVGVAFVKARGLDEVA